MDKWFINRGMEKVRRLVSDTGLDLRNVYVYTEAATGAYSMTAGLAALAGAETVHCVAKATRFGSAQEAIHQTREFAKHIGVDLERIRFSEGHEPYALSRADLVTNSGALRPLNGRVISYLRSSTVISLMYEPWEWRTGDIDLAAAKEKGVWVVGINENDPDIGCYAGAGMLNLKGLLDAGLEVFTSDVVLVCANRMVRHVLEALAPHCVSVGLLDHGWAGGVLPSNVARLDPNAVNDRGYDAMLIHDVPQLGRWNVADDVEAIWPLQCLGRWDACVQVMGDVRREDFPDVKFVPSEAPPRAYMGMNPSALGLDLVLRIVVAGLCAGAEMLAAIRRFGSTPRVKSEMAKMRWVLPLEEVGRD